MGRTGPSLLGAPWKSRDEERTSSSVQRALRRGKTRAPTLSRESSGGSANQAAEVSATTSLNPTKERSGKHTLKTRQSTPVKSSVQFSSVDSGGSSLIEPSVTSQRAELPPAREATSSPAPGGATCPCPPGVELLPVWEHSNGRCHQYAWDGRRLRTVDALNRKSTKPSDWLRLNFDHAGHLARTALMPQHVSEAYWPYMRWKFLQRTVSSILKVNATQAMLRAVGVGAKRALPSAAALNWVLKDGLGRMGRLSYAAMAGASIDSNLKRVRLGTSCLFTVCLGLEMLTPLAPRHFLALATLANVGKSIGSFAYLATTPAIHRTFARADNLADVSAKGQAQSVVADNLGLGFACVLGAAFRRRERLQRVVPMALFPLLAAVDLGSIYQELKAVPLRSLNKERLEMCASQWLRCRQVPSTLAASKAEHLVTPSLIDSGLLPLRIGPVTGVASSPQQLLALLQAQSEQPYVLRVSEPASWHPWSRAFRRRRKPHVHMTLRHDAAASDIVMAVLQVGHLRLMVECHLAETRSSPARLHDGISRAPVDAPLSAAASSSAPSLSAPSAPSSAPPVGACSSSLLRHREEQQQLWARPASAAADLDARWLEEALRTARARAQESVAPFMADMSRQGWATHHILLGPHQRCSYSTRTA
eukprot:jgi/Mesen1/7758/ME000408S06867